MERAKWLGERSVRAHSWFTVTVHCHCTLHTATAHCQYTLARYIVTVHCTLYSVLCTPQGLIECIPTHNTSATTPKSLY